MRLIPEQREADSWASSREANFKSATTGEQGRHRMDGLWLKERKTEAVLVKMNGRWCALYCGQPAGPTCCDGGINFTRYNTSKTSNIEMPSQVIRRLNKPFSAGTNLFDFVNKSDAYHKLNADVNL